MLYPQKKNRFPITLLPPITASSLDCINYKYQRENLTTIREFGESDKMVFS